MQNLIDPSVQLIVGLVVVALLVVGAGIILSARKTNAGKNPTFDAVLDALMPMVYRGIVAGQKAAITALNDFDTWLEGEDKQKIADSLYNLIPDVILVGTTPIPVNVVKRLVTKEDFSNLVKNVYDETAAFIRKNAEYFDHQIRDFVPDEYEEFMVDANEGDPTPEPLAPQSIS